MTESRSISYSCRSVYEEGIALLAHLTDGAIDARRLLEHACHIPTHRLLADPETPVAAADREQYLALVRRRAAREPLAYILGECEFMGLPFTVSPDVLIPEQDTENLVEEALRCLEDGTRILDLCTGSGCILLSLLHYSNHCTGVGTDLSPRALETAKKNAQALGLEERTTWLQGNLFEALENSERPEKSEGPEKSEEPENSEGPEKSEGLKKSEGPEKSEGLKNSEGSEKSERQEKKEPAANGRPAGSQRESSGAGHGDSDIPQQGPAGTEMLKTKRFDLVISNPPYIPTDVIETLAPEVRSAEPRMALDGGADGLDFYRRIIREAPRYLKIGGRLMLEIGFDQAESVTALLRAGGYYEVEIHRDYSGNDRVVTAVRSLRQE